MPIIECGFVNNRQVLEAIGPTAKVRIGFDPQYRSGAPPDLPPNEYPALIDTGATISCIDSGLANSLQLPPVDRQEMSSVEGSFEATIYVAQIHVLGLERVISGVFAGVHLQRGGQPHLALLGRRFLDGLKMVYEGRTGSVSIQSDP